MKFCVVIPTYQVNNHSSLMLDECIKHLNSFYKKDNVDIIVIDDYSPQKEHINKYNVHNSKHKGSAELSAYDFALENNSYDSFLIIHDNMIMNHKIDLNQTNKIKFIYHSNNHFNWPDWHKKDIFDLIEHLPNCDFKSNFKSLYEDKKNWFVCFGITSLISKSFLEELNEKTNIFYLNKFIIHKRYRMAMESIFAIACMYTIPELLKNPSIDGLLEDAYKINFNNKHIHKFFMNRLTEIDHKFEQNL